MKASRGKYLALSILLYCLFYFSGWAGANMTVIPEPAVLFLLSTGVAGLLGLGRKMKNEVISCLTSPLLCSE